VLGLLLLVACLALAPAAAAHDSHAPAGARHAWLPPEAWVYEHWLPFDQARLERALGLRGRQLEAYLFNDHHTLADLARHRGIDVAALADHLLEPWSPPLAPDRLAVLRERTIRVLTQGHLAQHMFFHAFHSFGMGPAVARELFGVSDRRLHHLRTRGDTPLAIARRHGTSRRRLLAGLTEVLRARHRAAIATGEVWPAAADRLLARQLELLPCWIRSPRPSADPGNPYGKATLQHGVHARGLALHTGPVPRRRAPHRARAPEPRAHVLAPRAGVARGVASPP
jgi:hypothetical protein